jgi:hypothetical protein
MHAQHLAHAAEAGDDDESADRDQQDTGARAQERGPAAPAVYRGDVSGRPRADSNSRER